MEPARLNWIAAGLLSASVLALAVLLALAARGRALNSRLVDVALLGSGIGIVVALVLVLLQGQRSPGAP